MSASREKNRRKEETSLGVSKQQLKEQEEAAKNKKFKRKVIIVVAVVVVIALALAVLTDCIPFFFGKIKDSGTAFTVADVKYSPADYNYFYYTVANEYKSNYDQYFDMLGIDADTDDFYEKEYADGLTWGDFFAQEAEKTMTTIGRNVTAAREAGFTLSEKAQQETEDYFSYLSSYAKNLGMDIDTYYQNQYGTGVTEKVYRRNVELSKLSEEYEAYIADGYKATYTDDDFETYYAEHPEDINVADFSYFFMNGIADSKSDETAQEALDRAKRNTDEFVERLKKGEDFADLCREYCLEISKTRYEDDDESFMHEYTYNMTNKTYADWVFDSARKSGDVETFEGDPAQSYTGYFIVMFRDAYRCDYETINYRNIKVNANVNDPETYGKSSQGIENPDSYDEYVEEQWATAEENVNGYVEQWKANGGDEDAFAEMTETCSADSETYDKGGMNSQVTKYAVDKEISEWLFDPARKNGDTKVFKTDDGYQFIFFSGRDLVRWKLQVSDILNAADMEAWSTSLADKYGEGKKSAFGMFYTR